MELEAMHDLAAAYALDALDPDDRRAFEAHLADCERCSDEVASFHETAAALALAAEGPEPPRELGERILAQARRERENVVPLRRRWVLPAAASIAAAAAAVAVGLGVWAASLSGSLGSERDARRAQERVLAVLADPAARHVSLRGAHGTLAVRPSGEAALVVSILPRAPHGKRYEAWVIAGGQPRPAGLFAGGRGGSAVLLDRSVPANAKVAVTLERASGASAPTGQPLFTS